MVKKFLAGVMLVMVLASGAWAARMDREHYSVASLKDGKADFAGASFQKMIIDVFSDDLLVDEETAKLTGTLRLSGGNYSFWNGTAMQSVSGTPMTYRLALASWVSSGDTASYMPHSDGGSAIVFGGEAENGLNGVTASWTFPDAPEMDGTFTLPNHKTTQEQLNSCVLYFEFIESGDLVTGINWRIVKAPDASTPASQDFAVNFGRFTLQDYNGNRIYDGRVRRWINPGETPEGVYMLDSPVKESDIWKVRTKVFTYEDGAEQCYVWFFAKSTEPEMILWNSHYSDASLINGKSDYSTAKFSQIFFDIETANLIMTDSRHFTDAGRVTVPGGGYTLANLTTGETLSTVAAGTDMTFPLRNHPDAEIGGSYVEYDVADSSGRLLAFTGGAESSLPGRTITWTLPAELNMNGSGVIKSYKTTAQQLTSGVPYVEVVSKDGYITAVNYRIVIASDTSTAITPAYRTDFRIYFDRATGKDVWASTYRPGWIRNTASGTLALDIPQPVSIVKRIRVRLRSYEDTDNPAIYQWNFYPASADITITTETLPDAQAGASYSTTLTANTSGATWQVSSGTLPAGLTLNTSGTISGIPLTEGTATFTVKATKTGWISAEKTFNLTVSRDPNPQTVEITTTTIPEGIVGMSYSAALASNPEGATWTLVGNLPAGLTLDQSGRISGFPTVSGNFPFIVTAAYGTASAVRSLSLTIAPLEITTETLPNGQVNEAYNQTISSNGSGLKWTINAGVIPPGLTLNEDSGLLSGTLNNGGSYTFTVYAYNTHASVSKEFTVNISARPSGGGGCASVSALAGLAIASILLVIRKH